MREIGHTSIPMFVARLEEGLQSLPKMTNNDLRAGLALNEKGLLAEDSEKSKPPCI